MAASSTTADRLALALAFLVIFVAWGTTYLAIRYAVEAIPPFVTAAVRHTTAGAILVAVAWVRGFRPRSGLAALLIASEPMWILVLGAAMGQQRINRLNGTGLLLGLAAAMARAALPMLCGGVTLALAAALTGELGALRWQAVSARSLGGLVYLISFGSLLAFVAYTRRRAGRRPAHSQESHRLREVGGHAARSFVGKSLSGATGWPAPTVCRRASARARRA